MEPESGTSSRNPSQVRFSEMILASIFIYLFIKKKN